MLEQIKQIPNYQSLTTQEIYAYLSEAIEVVNMRGWTPEAMRKEGGLTFNEAMVVMETLRQGQGLFASAFQWLSTSKEGLEFGSDEKQSLIDYASASANWEKDYPGLTAKMKALGRLTQTKWEQLGGMGSVPSVDAIAKTLVVAKCRDDMSAILQPIQAKSTALNAWLDSLDTSTKTVAEVQAYCAELLASPDGNPTEVV